MKKVFYLLFICSILCSYGCKRKQLIAGGQRDVIVVMTEEKLWTQIEEHMKDALEKEVFTPNREIIYELMHVLPENFSLNMYGKNLILIGYLNDQSESSNLISSFLTDKAKEMIQQKQGFIFEKENPWAIGQYLLIITSPGKPELSEIIEKRKNTILNYFEESSYKRAKWLIYSAGRQEKKEKKLQKEFSFSIDIPYGFYWKGEDTIKTFTKFVRKFPFRLISIGWKEKMVESISYDDACRIRDSIGGLYFEKDVIVKSKTKGKSTKFLDRDSYKLEGIWENNEIIMGGPFRTYFFNDTIQQRFYIVDIHVFAPGKKKWFYLKELESVASTFKTYPR